MLRLLEKTSIREKSAMDRGIQTCEPKCVILLCSATALMRVWGHLGGSALLGIVETVEKSDSRVRVLSSRGG